MSNLLNNKNRNVDIKLKERLKMFEEIDKMAKIDKMDPSNKGFQDEKSVLDNPSLYDYSDKGNTKTDEFSDNKFNLNLPMQSNSNRNMRKNSTNFQQNYIHSDQDRGGFSKRGNQTNPNNNNIIREYNTNPFYNQNDINCHMNYIESTQEIKSLLPTTEQDSIHRLEKIGNLIGLSVNERNNNYRENEENQDLHKVKIVNNIHMNKNQNFNGKNSNSNYNFYKNSKIKNKEFHRYPSKSPKDNLSNTSNKSQLRNTSEKLSDFENSKYDFPKQIEKSTDKKNLINIDKRLNEKNSYSKNYMKNNKKRQDKENDFENPFKKTIGNEIHSNFKGCNFKTELNISSNSKISKNSNQNRQNIDYNKEFVHNNQLTRPIHTTKEINKDFIECFDYDFYNFPLIKNIPDSKIEKNFKKSNSNQENRISLEKSNTQINRNDMNNQNQIQYNKKRNPNEFLNPNLKNNGENLPINYKSSQIIKKSNLTNSQLNNHNSKKIYRSNCKTSISNMETKSNKTNTEHNDKTANFGNSRTKSRDNTPRNIYKKSHQTKSSEKNFGERLYNYNHYYNEKLRQKLEEEDKIRQRSATPKITKKAQNLQRNHKDFHNRLYPFKNSNDIKLSNNYTNCQNQNYDYNSNSNLSTDQILLSTRNKNNKNFNKIYDNFRDDDEFEANIVYDKNFDVDSFYHNVNLMKHPNKRPNSSDLNHNYSEDDKKKIIHKNNRKKYFVNYYNKNIFEKKVHEDKSLVFKPQLNKKSLYIAEKFGPAIDRLCKGKKFKSSKSLLGKNGKNKSNDLVNYPYSDNSEFSDVSKGSASPNIISKRKINGKRPLELYSKGLEKMKIREEKTNQKKQTEEESYKKFSYRPKINSNFVSNISRLSPQNRISKVQENITNIKEETLKFDLGENLEGNLLGIPIINEEFSLIQQNLIANSEDMGTNIENCVSKDKDSNISNLSNIDKYKLIYEKNMMWKRRVETQTEKIKTSEENKIKKDLTFKPKIIKEELKTDEKFIERNIEQIQDYVNKRRANLQKQKDEEEYKQKKFSYGQNFVLKPTIPKEFNLSYAENRANVIKNNQNDKNPGSKFPGKSSNLPQNKINSNLLVIENGKNNKCFNNVDVNNIRSQFKIDEFFNKNHEQSQEIDPNDFEGNLDCVMNNIPNNEFYNHQNKNHFDYYSNSNQNNELINYNLQENFYYNSNNIKNTDEEKYRKNNNNYIQNYSNKSQASKKKNKYQENYKSYNNQQTNVELRTGAYENLKQFKDEGFEIENDNDNRNYYSENSYIQENNIRGNYSGNQIDPRDIITHNLKFNNKTASPNNQDQVAFINAISNLHEKLVNLNI